MALPERIGGKKAGGKPGGLVVAIGMKPKGIPSRIGGPKDEEETTPGPSRMSGAVAMDEAIEEMFAALDARNSGPYCGDDSDPMRKQMRDKIKATVREQFKDALRAFFYACDAEPHEEGEHTDEMEEET